MVDIGNIDVFLYFCFIFVILRKVWKFEIFGLKLFKVGLFFK